MLSIVSILAIAIGSNLAVGNCIIIAHKLNISEKLITMLILVIGTSTPEIIMGYTSAKKGEFDIILGNIIGTNIFNIGLVLGLPVILYGNVSTYSFNIIDMFFMILSGGLLYLFAKDDRKIDRFEGITMISIFIILGTSIYKSPGLLFGMKDFEFLITKIREYEQKYKRPWTNDTQYIDNVLGHLEKKWIPLVREKLKGE